MLQGFIGLPVLLLEGISINTIELGPIVRHNISREKYPLLNTIACGSQTYSGESGGRQRSLNYEISLASVSYEMAIQGASFQASVRPITTNHSQSESKYLSASYSLELSQGRVEPMVWLCELYKATYNFHCVIWGHT